MEIPRAGMPRPLFCISNICFCKLTRQKHPVMHSTFRLSCGKPKLPQIKYTQCVSMSCNRPPKSSRFYSKYLNLFTFSIYRHFSRGS